MALNPLKNSIYAPLPEESIQFLERVFAPPRLVAHLILVHDAAIALTAWLGQILPQLRYDREAVLFGAATHDIGKAVVPSELDQSGCEHELRGVELLRSLGVDADRARFAYTHNNWNTESEITIEDILVALSDKCWKGKRVEELESQFARLTSSATGRAEWECYAALDDFLTDIARAADEKLEWQRTFSSSRSE